MASPVPSSAEPTEAPESATAPTIHLVLVRSPLEPLDDDPYHSFIANARLRPPVRVHHLPVLATRSVGSSALADIVRTGPARRFAGVILTSARAVPPWASALADLSSAQRTPWDNLPCFVVGPATRAALRAAVPSVRAVLGDAAGTAERLAPLILAHFHALALPPASAPRKLLFLVGDKTSDTLERALSPHALALVTQQVYCTAPDHAFPAAVAHLLADVATLGPAELWLAFFSPSGAGACLAVLRSHDWLPPRQQPRPTPCPASDSPRSHLLSSPPAELQPRPHLRLAAIGPTTAAFLVDHEHLAVDAVADAPTPADLVRAVQTAPPLPRY